MTHLWFAAKRYGYGWYPCTWQGWLVVLFYVVSVITPTFFLPKEGENIVMPTVFIVYVMVMTAILITISVKKGEKARWRWGE